MWHVHFIFIAISRIFSPEKRSACKCTLLCIHVLSRLSNTVTCKRVKMFVTLHLQKFLPIFTVWIYLRIRLQHWIDKSLQSVTHSKNKSFVVNSHKTRDYVRLTNVYATLSVGGETLFQRWLLSYGDSVLSSETRACVPPLWI